MFVKDALEEEVGIVVELCGAVWRNFQPREMKYCINLSNVVVNDPEQSTR